MIIMVIATLDWDFGLGLIVIDNGEKCSFNTKVNFID